MNKADFHKNLTTRISLKNPTKLGDIPTLSISPVKGCLNCAKCQKYCYALKAYNQYPDTKKAWDKNLRLVTNDLDQMKHDLKDFLTIYKPNLFRLHMAGDFITQKYLDMWIDVIRLNPKTTFLAYTKSYDCLEFNDIPQNLKLFYSVEPDSPLPKKVPNGVRLAFIETDTRINTKNSFYCPSTSQTKEQKKAHRITCAECQLCFKAKKNVIFHLS